MIRGLTVYTIVVGLFTLIDLSFVLLAFGKKERIGDALGFVAAFAGVIKLSYLCSISVRSQLLTSIMSSLCFIGIDWLLVFLVYFALLATGMQRSRRLFRIICGYALFDSLVLLVNIFTGVAVGYQPLVPVGIHYQMKPLYIAHLVFTYLLVGVILWILVAKCVRTPGEYRSQFYLLIAAIAVVVLINAVFLFPNTDSFFTRVDCSVFGYSIGLYLLYWIAYIYRHRNLQKALAFTVVDNINQGVVLFDYADEMILHNASAERLLKGIELREHMPQEKFAEACGLREMPDDTYALQYDREEGKPVRCEFRRIRDRRGRSTGGLYVFTDISRDADDVTGFEYGVNLRTFAHENPADFIHPTAVAVFDIIGLGEVNRVLGRDVGDARIRALARAMRSNLPEGTALFRGYEAQLIAVCIHTSESAFLASVQKVVEACESTVYFGISATVDSSDKTEQSAASRSVEQALDTAYRDLQTKKLLNTGSVRSQTLSSLVRALEETDADTEAHVRRTQKMGVALGRKLGLSDAELTDLQLLCLLHDIGKISIPLDILNKPGKLTEEEWAVLRTHPEKGYQIARTSDELKSIAEMILYHHERWDGGGYPEKLAGEQIPVLSRIIAIVDAYDAMVNDRSYRKALPPEKAQEEIRLNAGTGAGLRSSATASAITTPP